MDQRAVPVPQIMRRQPFLNRRLRDDCRILAHTARLDIECRVGLVSELEKGFAVDPQVIDGLVEFA